MIKGIYSVLIIFILQPFWVMGQQAYTVKLKSGQFIPVENFKEILVDKTILQPALFNDNYYVVIQFNQIPSEKDRTVLELNDIKLVDYIPEKAYSSIISSKIFFKCIKTLPIRSIFVLKSDQKIHSDLKKNKIPNWAIKEQGFVDVNANTISSGVDPAITNSLQVLNIKIIENQQVYRNLVLRVPINKIYDLANLQFIQWIEPIPPPDKNEIKIRDKN